MTTSHGEPRSWLLGSYQIDGDRRELRAVRVPGDQTLHIIDVLANPREEDGELDERNVEERVGGFDEAQAIARSGGRRGPTSGGRGRQRRG
jgi:hypothetical protein